MKLKCKARRYLSLFSCNSESHMTNYFFSFKLSTDVEKNPRPTQSNTDSHETIIKPVMQSHIDECHYVSTTPLQSNASISMYNKSTTDIQSSINKHFIMSIYAICFSIIKSCTYWDSSTLQALHEHACLFYEKCDVHSVSKMPSIVTIYGVDIEIVVS
ncbi:unnamed protein product, partial [Pocillopora meandrina]